MNTSLFGWKFFVALAIALPAAAFGGHLWHDAEQGITETATAKLSHILDNPTGSINR